MLDKEDRTYMVKSDKYNDLKNELETDPTLPRRPAASGNSTCGPGGLKRSDPLA